MGEDHVIGLAKNWKVSSLSCFSSTLIADCENCERGLGSMTTKAYIREYYDPGYEDEGKMSRLSGHLGILVDFDVRKQR